jgi:cytochrome c553
MFLAKTKTKLMAGYAAVFAFAILIASCSNGLKDAPKIDSLLGKHPVGWAKDHWYDFLAKPGQCEACHGSVTNRAQAGGISKVSCFSCHVDGVSHTAGFANWARHGRNAAQKEPSPALINMAGFESCQKCHGTDYKGRSTAVSCMACHTRAPHPNRPWTAYNANVVSHHMTADGNARACAQCHTAGANSTRVPAQPPVAGAPPGCFNNTLCHARDF